MHQTSGTVIILEETTKEPITLMGARAGYCQRSDVTNPVANYKRGIQCLNANHGRVMEYVNVEMVLSGWSIHTMREWYTHIGGSPTRLQDSTRMVDYSNFNYVMPDTIGCDPKLTAIYKKAMHTAKKCYKELVEHGAAIEDAAYVLPLGTESVVVDKRNLRNLITMSNQRLCKKAGHMYRDLFQMVCSELHDYSTEWAYLIDNYFVPKCMVYGKCTEKHSCGYFEQQMKGMCDE